MEILIWSDFICPFCYIGDAHLEKALTNLSLKDEAEIHYKSFQLMPDASYQPGETYAESFLKSKGGSKEEVDQMLEQISAMASQAGLSYNFDEAKLANSFDAHRLFQYSKELNKGREFFHRLYRAHFTEGIDISDHQSLLGLSLELGLDEERVKDILAHSEKYELDVHLEINQAGQVGVQGVPFFVFNQKYGLSGAQPVEVFEEVLEKVQSES